MLTSLLRPGRFDRRVTVSPPDRTGREAILNVHTRGVPLADDVDLNRIAASTPGMVGADLANLVNEAALLAARRGHDAVREADFTDALERIILGAERQVMMTPEDRRRTAYHERPCDRRDVDRRRDPVRKTRSSRAASRSVFLCARLRSLPQPSGAAALKVALAAVPRRSRVRGRRPAPSPISSN